MVQLHAGDVIAGKYRCDRVLGAGAVGFVVAATHMHLGQPVALKFLKATDPAGVARLAREAQAAARLKGNHVARVLDVGTHHSGEPYIVMEYLTGSDLATLLKERGSLPVEEACGYIIEACEALAEAHAQGIIHRDIKPANLFVARGPTGVP